jgi:hypothetical protein
VYAALVELVTPIFLELGTTSTTNIGIKESRKRKANVDNDSVPSGYEVLCIFSKRCPHLGVYLQFEDVLVVDKFTLGRTKCVAPTTVTAV